MPCRFEISSNHSLDFSQIPAMWTCPMIGCMPSLPGVCTLPRVRWWGRSTSPPSPKSTRRMYRTWWRSMLGSGVSWKLWSSTRWPWAWWTQRPQQCRQWTPWACASKDYFINAVGQREFSQDIIEEFREDEHFQSMYSMMRKRYATKHLDVTYLSDNLWKH